MKLALIATLVVVGLGAVAARGFNSAYLEKIIEVANQDESFKSTDNTPNVASDSTPRASLNCLVLSGGTPTSVHALRPQDIEIIGAIGDSLTVILFDFLFLFRFKSRIICPVPNLYLINFYADLIRNFFLI